MQEMFDRSLVSEVCIRRLTTLKGNPSINSIFYIFSFTFYSIAQTHPTIAFMNQMNLLLSGIHPVVFIHWERSFGDAMQWVFISSKQSHKIPDGFATQLNHLKIYSPLTNSSSRTFLMMMAPHPSHITKLTDGHHHGHYSQCII